MLNSQGRLDIGLVVSCAISRQALMVAVLVETKGSLTHTAVERLERF